jgi:Na+/melibiose symporter-like transporter
MLALLPYIQQAMLLANMTPSVGQKSSSDKCLMWLTVGSLLLAYILIIVGLGLYLADNYELPIAFMVTGLVVLSSVLCVIAVRRAYKTLRNRKIENTIKSATDDITKLVSNFTNEVGDTFKDNAGLAALIVAGLGFLLARKIVD